METYSLSPRQIKKLNKRLNKDFNPELPVTLEFDKAEMKAWVYCIPEEKLEIPFNVAFNR